MGPYYELLQFFQWMHLPEHLQAVSKPFGELAELMAKTLPENVETVEMLRKLLEAKDCAVRAMIFKWF
jgi:ferritin-like protein